MVQADASRNYYADLSVPPTADENEIRKAFRKLALKYHPDRNPGREAEFVTKFQQIQAAHEILTDPAQRIKYDNDRRKQRGLNIPPYNNTTPRRPPPPPRNAYSTTTTPSGTYYRPRAPQPPPQRPPPPQHHSTFANGADRFSSRNFRAPPTAQQPKTWAQDAEAKNDMFTAWQKMKPPRANDQARQSSAPNANNPNGTPFGRSASTRVPSRKGFDPATPGADEGQARSAYSSNYERPVPSPPQRPADPLKHFREQEGDVPYSEANRVRTPYASAAGERTSMYGDGLGRSSSVRNSPTYGHRPTQSADGRSFSDSDRKKAEQSHASGAKAFPQMYPSSSDDESEPEILRSPRSPLSGRSAYKPKASPLHQHSRPQGTNDRPTAFKSKSDEAINVKFSPSDWHGKFEGSADYFVPTTQKAASKGKTSPSRGRQAQRSTTAAFPEQSQPPPPSSPFSMSNNSKMPPPPPPRPSVNTDAKFPDLTEVRSAPQSAKFEPEAWAGTFKEPSFVMPTTTKETSPRRGSSAAAKRSKAQQRKPSNAPNGTTKDAKVESEESKPKYQAFAEDVIVDAEMMDVDTNTPPTEQSQHAASGADNRYKPGTPIRFSQTAPSSPQEESATRRASVPSGQTAASAADPPSKNTRSQKSGLNGLSGLGKVEPLQPAQDAGLSGLGSLSDNLPFESGPSNSHPMKPTTAKPLQYPFIPSAPTPPATLDEASTRAYLTQMQRYITHFRTYNQTMCQHFSARDAELEALYDQATLARGEPREKIGFASYKRKMEEDNAAMESWKVAQEMHIKALGQCEEVRNKTLKFGEMGSKGRTA